MARAREAVAWVLGRGGELALVALALALVVSQIAGGPVVLGFVETGSMRPVLEPGDGFVAVPAPAAGEIERGDVVVYRAEVIQGGGLTTHRVVGRTDGGYVTRGDANALTDQQTGEPPVARARIVSEVVRVGGSVLVLPRLGAVAAGLRGAVETVRLRLALLLGTGSLPGANAGLYAAGVAFALYLLDLARARRRGGRDRERSRDRSRETGIPGRTVLALSTVLLLVGLTLPMVVPSGTEGIEMVSANFASEQPTVVEAGGSDSHTRRLENGGLVPVRVFLTAETDHVAVQPRTVALGPREDANVTVTLAAPPETGAETQYVSHHRYLALLPASTLARLHAVHPWLPVVAIDALVGVPFYLVGRIVLGRGRVRGRARAGRARGR